VTLLGSGESSSPWNRPPWPPTTSRTQPNKRSVRHSVGPDILDAPRHPRTVAQPPSLAGIELSRANQGRRRRRRTGASSPLPFGKLDRIQAKGSPSKSDRAFSRTSIIERDGSVQLLTWRSSCSRVSQAELVRASGEPTSSFVRSSPPHIGSTHKDASEETSLPSSLTGADRQKVGPLSPDLSLSDDQLTSHPCWQPVALSGLSILRPVTVSESVNTVTPFGVRSPLPVVELEVVQTSLLNPSIGAVPGPVSLPWSRRSVPGLFL
jgi:hypothetical protein